MLQLLRQQLAALRRVRQRTRWGTAYAALGIAVLLTLGVLFAVDVGYELRVFQRIVMMLFGGAVIVWVAQRFAAPWLGVRESEIDIALYVEHQHGIDTDLVAALQFESPAAASWGSPKLEQAVVARVAELQPKLNVFQGMNYERFYRRLKWFGGLTIIALAVTAIWPRHVAVFFSRLLLSSRHYPSDTTIESLAINGTPVLKWNPLDALPREIPSAQGRPVAFLVKATGVQPTVGQIACRSLTQGAARSLELRRLSTDERLALVPNSAGGEDPRIGWYLAEMPRLVEDFEYIVRLGDAWTDPSRIRMLELPAVEVAIQVTPPEYAAGATNVPQSTRHLSVLEGSRVELLAHSINLKPLKSASAKITANGQTTAHALTAVGAERLTWQLAGDSPLSRVTFEVRYEIQVEDEDGLALETPLHGFVQLKSDRPPTAVAMVVHRVVLPTAVPVVEYRLNDDYGIASAVLHAQVERGRAKTDDSATAAESSQAKIPLDPQPVIGKNLPHRGKYAFDLQRLKLEKGDQLKLTLEVVDHRGDLPGQNHLSEPVLLEISDEAGVLAAITEADERSEKRLTDVIQQQLGVGGKK